jgi:hypothetical protein
MTKLRRRMAVVTTVGTLAFGVLDQNALGDPAVLPLRVRVDDHAAIPEGILTLAKAVVARIYSKAGVGLVWAGPSVVTPDPHGEPDPFQQRDSVPTFRIIIVPDSLAERVDADSKALGLATGNERQPGHLAYVFYDRVRNLSVRYEDHRGGVLGHVIAHEIGHLLLPRGTHSETGLMRADWSRDDLEHVVHGTLLFTPWEAALIRKRLAQATSRTPIGMYADGWLTRRDNERPVPRR